jgi:hypothetical protein
MASQLYFLNFHADDDNGAPLAGGLVYTYVPETRRIPIRWC